MMFCTKDGVIAMTNVQAVPGGAPPSPDEGGWKVRSLAGFAGTAGPLWTRREGDGWAYGFQMAPAHLNPAGVVHGGALLTLVDHAISTVAWEACGRVPCVTLQLDSQFLTAVRQGQFAQARAQITHRTHQMLFMQGSVAVDGQMVLRAQAIVKVLPAERLA